MSLAEILDELLKLTEQERENIRHALDLQKEEDQAIDEGFRSLEQELPIPWPEFDRLRFTKNVMVRQKPHVVKVLAIERREGTRV